MPRDISTLLIRLSMPNNPTKNTQCNVSISIRPCVLITKAIMLRGIRHNHVCSACFSNGRTFPHAEVDCKNKFKKVAKSKNKYM